MELTKDTDKLLRLVYKEYLNRKKMRFFKRLFYKFRMSRGIAIRLLAGIQCR